MGDECTLLYMYDSSTPACATPLCPPLAIKVDIAISHSSPILPNRVISVYYYMCGDYEGKKRKRPEVGWLTRKRKTRGGGWGGEAEVGGVGGILPHPPTDLSDTHPRLNCLPAYRTPSPMLYSMAL